jgi:hypothetical protein
MTTIRCILCPSTDRDGAPRDPNWAATGLQVCEGHYTRTEEALAVIPRQFVMLSAAPGSGSGQARVSGSAEPTLGVRVPVLDLIGPANTGTVHDDFKDQFGMPSVATVLEMWCLDWAGVRGRGESRPKSTVPMLAKWLRDRLPWAAAEHPALLEFSDDLHRTAWALKAANGDLPAPDEHKAGVECAKCDCMALYDVGDFIECLAESGGCKKLYTLSEYWKWVELKGYCLRAEIFCTECGTAALAGAAHLNKVECLRAKDGCGHRMTWKQYTKVALAERRPERADWAVA